VLFPTAAWSMNRHERRAAKALSKTAKLDLVVAVHEAGHAVARVLTAPNLGLPLEKAISYIEVGARKPMSESTDGKMGLVSQAITFGPMLSTDIHAAFARIVANVPKDQVYRQHITDAITLARSEGADIETWLRARMLIAVFASAAEAKHTNRQLRDVWNSYEAENDVRQSVSDGLHAGLTTSEIEVFIEEALDHSAALIKQPHIQSAIYALADALPGNGTMPGKQAVQIITQALSGDPSRL
jgi:hypothetical protein